MGPLISARMKLKRHVMGQNRCSWGCPVHLDYCQVADNSCHSEASEGSKGGSWGWQTQLDHSQVCTRSSCVCHPQKPLF